jgi:hypothetical protein
MGRAFSPEQSAYVLSPEFSIVGYQRRWPDDERSVESLTRHRRRYGDGGPVGLTPKADDPQVSWDKHEIDYHWTDVLAPYDLIQRLRKRSSGAQDTATIRVDSDEPVALCFISDWHIGSWGTSLRAVAEMTKRISDAGVRLAVLGDMLQMAIRLRGVLEISDNMMPPRDQFLFWDSWSSDMAHLILWATWDNHAVQREEDATGFSFYAHGLREKCVYHSGIGHIDLEVGDQTYHIASSHRFSGNTKGNAVGGLKKYMRFEGIDRELAVSGDTHRPAFEHYFDGPLPRIAMNCGTLQDDSGFGKRNISLYAHDAMPVVLFYPDEHMMIPFQSLQHYQKVVS